MIDVVKELLIWGNWTKGTRGKMKAKMNEYMAKGQPTHRKERTTNSNYDVVNQFQAEFRGFAQYYLLAYNAHQQSL